MKLKRVVLRGSASSLNYKASFEAPEYELELFDTYVLINKTVIIPMAHIIEAVTMPEGVQLKEPHKLDTPTKAPKKVKE
jgi:hypothetical protein